MCSFPANLILLCVFHGIQLLLGLIIISSVSDQSVLPIPSSSAKYCLLWISADSVFPTYNICAVIIYITIACGIVAPIVYAIINGIGLWRTIKRLRMRKNNENVGKKVGLEAENAWGRLWGNNEYVDDDMPWDSEIRSSTSAKDKPKVTVTRDAKKMSKKRLLNLVLTWFSLLLFLFVVAIGISYTTGLQKSCEYLLEKVGGAKECGSVIFSLHEKQINTLWAGIGSTWILAFSWISYFVVTLIRGKKQPPKSHPNTTQSEIKMKNITQSSKKQEKIPKADLEMIDPFKIEDDAEASNAKSTTKNDLDVSSVGGWGENWGTKTSKEVSKASINPVDVPYSVDTWGGNGAWKTKEVTENAGWGDMTRRREESAGRLSEKSDGNPFSDKHDRKNSNPFL
ncbi:hypothetical protein HK098_002350 [Nowakowskiella sp. JEL0407]|nr:hypothetical protein HK098_002350 [Nowakowskiella sp. JEL0407]